VSGRVALGGLLGLVALVLLVTSVAQCGSSVRGFIADRYDRTGTRDGAAVYATDQPVRRVVGDIADRWEPADRVTSPAGVFLRYSDTIVAVHPRAGRPGTEIEVADERRGYGLWFPYVGGWFGSSGRGGKVRGGGPGTGK
jgi:hypothetical protein